MAGKHPDWGMLVSAHSRKVGIATEMLRTRAEQVSADWACATEFDLSSSQLGGAGVRPVTARGGRNPPPPAVGGCFLAWASLRGWGAREPGSAHATAKEPEPPPPHRFVLGLRC